jgi:hypothetical protein
MAGKKAKMKLEMPKRPMPSVRANLVTVRPPGESQKTLKRDADKMLIEIDTDEVRIFLFMVFLSVRFPCFGLSNHLIRRHFFSKNFSSRGICVSSNFFPF